MLLLALFLRLLLLGLGLCGSFLRGLLGSILGSLLGFFRLFRLLRGFLLGIAVLCLLLLGRSAPALLLGRILRNLRRLGLHLHNGCFCNRNHRCGLLSLRGLLLLCSFLGSGGFLHYGLALQDKLLDRTYGFLNRAVVFIIH